MKRTGRRFSRLNYQWRERKGDEFMGTNVYGLPGSPQQLASTLSHMPTALCNSIALLAVLTGTLSLSAIDFLGEGDQKQVLYLVSCVFWGK